MTPEEAVLNEMPHMPTLFPDERAAANWAVEEIRRLRLELAALTNERDDLDDDLVLAKKRIEELTPTAEKPWLYNYHGD